MLEPPLQLGLAPLNILPPKEDGISFLYVPNPQLLSSYFDWNGSKQQWLRQHFGSTSVKLWNALGMSAGFLQQGLHSTALWSESLDRQQFISFCLVRPVESCTPSPGPPIQQSWFETLLINHTEILSTNVHRQSIRSILQCDATAALIIPSRRMLSILKRQLYLLASLHPLHLAFV